MSAAATAMPGAVRQRRLARLTAPPAIVPMPGLRDITRLTPELTGVYFLCKHGGIVYIGQSVNVIPRVCNHHIDASEFTHVYFAPCGKRDLSALEAALIRHFKPRLNGTYSRGGMRTSFSPRERDLDLLAKYGVRSSEVQRWLDALNGGTSTGEAA